MRVAGIDIGSNTSLLLVADLPAKGFDLPVNLSAKGSNLPAKGFAQSLKILEDRLFFTRLAEGFSKTSLAGPKISKKAFKRQEDFFKIARTLIHQYSVKKIKCVATAAGRKAMNAKKLISLAKNYGFVLKIISAEEEAKLSRKGALFNLPLVEEKTAVLDIGGASTEISTAHQFFSLPIGSVNLTENFLHKDPPDQKEILSLMQAIQQEISSIPFSFSKNLSPDLTLVATAGTPTTLAGLKHSTSKLKELHGETLSVREVHNWWEDLFSLSFEKRKSLKGMPSYRADVMPAGLSILKQIMNQYQWNECLVSVAGLRYGLLYQFPQKQK